MHIFYCDDDRDDIEFFKQIIRRIKPETKITTAVDPEQALASLEEMSPKPDFLFFDSSMPKMDGLELTRRVTQKYSSCKVILLTLYDEYLTNAMEAGARGYLLKDIRRKELAQAIRHVHSGQVVISEGVKALP